MEYPRRGVLVSAAERGKPRSKCERLAETSRHHLLHQRGRLRRYSPVADDGLAHNPGSACTSHRCCLRQDCRILLQPHETEAHFSFKWPRCGPLRLTAAPRRLSRSMWSDFPQARLWTTSGFPTIRTERVALPGSDCNLRHTLGCMMEGPNKLEPQLQW